MGESTYSEGIAYFTEQMNDHVCYWDCLADYIQCEVLGFCGCGLQDPNLIYVMNGLSHIGEVAPDGGAAFSEWYSDWHRRGLEFFGNEQSRYFFFYWADKNDLTEHGGSVPGWLTNKGKRLLNALFAMTARGDFDDEED